LYPYGSTGLRLTALQKEIKQMRAELRMSKKERDRKAMLKAVKQGYIDLKAASGGLDIVIKDLNKRRNNNKIS
jgi:hypothetical protein